MNDAFGYRLALPATATVTEGGVESFPNNELPAGVTVDEYLNQLRTKYPGRLCVFIQYELSYVAVSAPPNLHDRYAPCGRTGIGDYEVLTRTEVLTIEGQTYQAEGWEVIGAGGTLANHNEFFRVVLPDNMVIEYGSLPDENATYADYLKYKSALLEIVESFRKLR